VGKPLEEAIAVFPRICSFCSAAHKVTALQAAENAIGLEPTDQTKRIRYLLYLGDQIESHALHLFFLVLPDFLGYVSALKMNKDYPEVISTALKLKDVGANIQKIIGSRYIHQENALIGGFGKLPTKNAFSSLAKTIDSVKKDSETALEVLSKFKLWPEVTSRRTHLALKPYDDYGILGDSITTSDGREFKGRKYNQYIIEKVVPHSFAKHCLYNNKPFMTGALSRVTLYGEGMNGRARELAISHKEYLDLNNPLANNFAQAIELIYFVEKSRLLAEELAATLNENEIRIKPTFNALAEGFSVSEAPRGILTYNIGVDKNGQVTNADIITPTAMFLAMIEKDLKKMTQVMLDKGINVTQEIGKKLETIVRAYDPCISCSVHVGEVI
jgi:sulfhydrogenase subunit alpha